MLLDVVERHLEIATESFARAEHFSEQADFFVAFQLRKIQQLLAAIVLALVLDLEAIKDVALRERGQKGRKGIESDFHLAVLRVENASSGWFWGK